ncbi:hypothetical protein OAQ84_00185 [Bdellovibrionales bacterium]|nr:hypothetical protein [Bdellovibrionales bacterium]
MRNLSRVKAQDILVMLKLIVSPQLNQKELAENLDISSAEISHGFRRLKHSKLLTTDNRVNIEASSEFLIHALKYIYPPQFGTVSVGIPTGYAKPGFDYVRYDKDDIYIWPHPEGKVKGIALKPFYPSLPKACLQDEKLYTLASLVEMIRMGRVREQKVASKELVLFIRKYL